MDKKTVSGMFQCGSTITVSVLLGVASAVTTCPQCGTGYELVVRPCPSCNTTRYIVPSPGSRTGDPRCQRCVSRDERLDEELAQMQADIASALKAMAQACDEASWPEAQITYS